MEHLELTIETIPGRHLIVLCIYLYIFDRFFYTHIILFTK